MKQNVILFGASGFLGSQIMSSLESNESVNPILVTHSKAEEKNWVTHALGGKKVHGVVWSQGLNSSDTVESFDEDVLDMVMNANLWFIIRTLRNLLDAKAIEPGARMVILSSVWQNLSRENKFSYTVSKSAVSGVVKSLAADLGKSQISVNAVLPGVVDSPMTRANLTNEQVEKIESETPGSMLVTSYEVASVVSWLLDPASSGVNGQSIVIDRGWSGFRRV